MPPKRKTTVDADTPVVTSNTKGKRKTAQPVTTRPTRSRRGAAKHRPRTPDPGEQVEPEVDHDDPAPQAMDIDLGPEDLYGSDMSETLPPVISTGPRRSSRGLNPHPAWSHGLEVRFQSDISAAAAAKRTAHNELSAAKAEVLAEIKRKRDEGIKKLALIEDAMYEEELEEARNFARGSGRPARVGDNGADSGDRGEDDEAMMNAPAAKKRKSLSTSTPEPTVTRLTFKQKNKQEASDIRNAIQAHRTTADDVQDLATSTHRSATSTKQAGPARKHVDAFEEGWIGGRSASKNTPAPGRGGTARGKSDSTSPPLTLPRIIVSSRTSRSRYEASSSQAKPGDSDLEVEEAEAFNDASVSTSRQAAVDAGRNRENKLVHIVTDEDESPLPESEDARGFAKRRAPRSVVDPAKSRGIGSIPEWIQPIYKTQVIPTILAFYGSQINPFLIDGEDGNLLLSLLTEVVSAISPEQHYTAVQGDKIYAQTKREIQNWIKEFPRTAITAVTAAVKPFLSKPSQVRSFVADALNPGGAAFWGQPHPTEFKDAFQSPYMIAAFGHHVRDTSGSRLDTDGTWNATGALLLSIMAVLRAFSVYASGKFVVPRDQFSFEKLERPMREWLKGRAVQDFLRKPHRQEQLYQKVASTERRSRSAKGVTSYSVMDICDRSSPPPECQ
ncbi:hypothetical protein BV25DRAFT_1988120 [Artomyces pyxidatus]|uniref:Uncharacterized protein n=1 Tax=Artomyces pyxidatus TaxID=48021 RepID=A0ACB8TF75_9AGAM|nr:hypothetical protein BV25DRAFT_1988120 [Artomyces pyxidatus]